MPKKKPEDEDENSRKPIRNKEKTNGLQNGPSHGDNERFCEIL